MKKENNHDHDHGHEESATDAEVTNTGVEVTEPVVLENTVERHDHAEHSHEGLDSLLEVMFGFEHVVAEIFWNTVWLGAAFAVGRLIAFRKVHKYIDDKHGVKHEKEGY
jgi:hypothetical protein